MCENVYDMIIVGSGPAGLTAGIYGKRAGLKVVILESGFIQGGQIVNTYEVDNYPGMPGISGLELAEKLKEHVTGFGVEIARGKVKGISLDGEWKIVHTKKADYRGKAVILAAGAVHRKLEVPGEEELAGMGVSYCATCDGAFFKDKTVAVVGGGDVAVEDAIFLETGVSDSSEGSAAGGTGVTGCVERFPQYYLYLGYHGGKNWRRAAGAVDNSETDKDRRKVSAGCGWCLYCSGNRTGYRVCKGTGRFG